MAQVPELKDVPPIFRDVFNNAWKLGFIQGGITTREQVIEMVRTYADLVDSELFTARDAFKVMLDTLVEGDDLTKEILAEFDEKKS
jgi:hypothetical protein